MMLTMKNIYENDYGLQFGSWTVIPTNINMLRNCILKELTKLRINDDFKHFSLKTNSV